MTTTSKSVVSTMRFRYSIRGTTTNSMMFLKTCGIIPKSPHELLFMAFYNAQLDFISSLTRINHKGAMMELGEGLCKLRKMNFDSGPFHQFEREISAVLEFIYQTQLEKAAGTDEFCKTMDQSQRSYQLLDGYAPGDRLYYLEFDRNWNAYIVFSPEKYCGTQVDPPKIKIPVLEASEQHILDLEYT